MPMRPALSPLASCLLLLTTAGCGPSPEPPQATPAAPAPVPDDAAAWLLELRGDVKVKRPGEPRWEQAEPDGRFGPGDRIRVDRGTARIEFRNGEKQLLRKGTIIEIRSFERPQEASPAPPDPAVPSGQLLNRSTTG